MQVERNFRDEVKDEIVIYPSKFKIALLMIGAIIFICLGIGFVSLDNMPWWIVLIGGIAIPLFSFSLLYYCYRFFVPKPALIINNHGVYDNASALSAGLIGWSEISSIFAYNYKGQRFLGIIPFDPENILKRQNSIKRRIMKLNMGILEKANLPPTPINIPQNTLPMKVDELISKILEFRNLGIKSQYQ